MNYFAIIAMCTYAILLISIHIIIVKRANILRKCIKVCSNGHLHIPEFIEDYSNNCPKCQVELLEDEK